MKKIKVNEIFYSLQGEGINTGMPAIFIRLANCNLSCSFCDTEFNSFTEMSIEDIKETLKSFTCNTIIWTGGEPTLQLDDEILGHFSTYTNMIETNGTRAVPSLIDYISCSPKVPVHTLCKNISFADEFRFAVTKDDRIPKIDDLPPAKAYLLSPIFNNDGSINSDNLHYCINYIKTNNAWRLSLQTHKLIAIE